MAIVLVLLAFLFLSVLLTSGLLDWRKCTCGTCPRCGGRR